MGTFGKSMIDAALAVTLFGSLFLVFVLDPKKTSIAPGPPPTPPDEKEFKIYYGDAPKPETKTVEPKPLRLGVTPKVFDDMGALLRQQGKALDFVDIQEFQIGDTDFLQKFDVIFLTCSSDSAGSPQAQAALRAFVDNGGTLYASDLRFQLLRNTFQQYVDQEAINKGVLPGPNNITINASILDAGLREYLKADKIDLTFPSPGWEPAAIRRDMATIFLEGSYVPPGFGASVTTPLMVKFHPSKTGTVIFTSFHNAQQNADAVRKLLEYLIFRTVTAQAEIQMTQQMQSQGFEPRPSTLITASANAPSVTKQHQSQKVGRLRIGLSFNPSDTRLKLTVKGPDGKVGQAEHNSSFTIERLNAPVGTWEYTVTAINMTSTTPYSVVIAEEK